MAKNKPFDDYQGSKSFPARLQELVLAWQKLSEAPLKHRKTLIKLRSSGYYDPQYTKWHVLNLVDRGISTIVPFLIEGSPKVNVSTRVLNYRPFAATAKLGLNYLIEKMGLAQNVLIPGAANSLIGAMITRTDFYYERIISLKNEVIQIGTPHVELVDDSSYVGDPSAKRRCDFVMEGDVYTLPTEYAKDFFGKDVADYIEADKVISEYSPKQITQPDYQKQRLALRDQSTFIDIYLRDEGTIVTIMPKGKRARILRTKEWEGPGDGPYDYLGYTFMPETPVPIPPAWLWHDMDISVNLLVDKMRELAENQKDVLAFSDEAADDVKRLINSPNASTCKVANVEAMKTISLNGIKDRSNWDWVNFLLMEQTKQGANPDIMAGRGAQAPTFGQEQLIYQNATRNVNNMYNRFQDTVVSIVKKLAWAFWTDPLLHVPVIKDIPGFGPLPEVFSSIDKVGDFYDFIFDIEPYSTQRTSPEMKYQKVMQFMAQWVLPTMQMASSQGASLDIPTVTKILADYAGINDFNQYYTTTVPDPGSIVPYQMQPVKEKRSDMRQPKQTSDAFGTNMGNQMANLNQQQSSSQSSGQSGSGVISGTPTGGGAWG